MEVVTSNYSMTKNKLDINNDVETDSIHNDAFPP